MITTALRDADPAANPRSLPISETAADEMLREILSTPRVAAPSHRRRRLVVLSSSVAAAAAAAVVAPILVTGGGLGAPSAYAVERHDDGSFEVAIDFEQFSDPAALQRTLDEKGIPATVLSGPGSTLDIDANGKIQGSYEVPDCAKYDRLPDPQDTRTDDRHQPVAMDTSPRFGDTSLRLRPDLLPAGATFVIQILQSQGHVAALSGDVAVGAAPTCLP